MKPHLPYRLLASIDYSVNKATYNLFYKTVVYKNILMKDHKNVFVFENLASYSLL